MIGGKLPFAASELRLLVALRPCKACLCLACSNSSVNSRVSRSCSCSRDNFSISTSRSFLMNGSFFSIFPPPTWFWVCRSLRLSSRAFDWRKRSSLIFFIIYALRIFVSIWKIGIQIWAEGITVYHHVIWSVARHKLNTIYKLVL